MKGLPCDRHLPQQQQNSDQQNWAKTGDQCFQLSSVVFGSAVFVAPGSSCSKDIACGEYQVVVVRVKLRSGDLHARAAGNSLAALRVIREKLELAQRDSRRQKVLRLAVVLPPLEVRQVRFQLRP